MRTSDQAAVDSFVALLESMRDAGIHRGRIEVTVDADEARTIRLVTIGDSRVLHCGR